MNTITLTLTGTGIKWGGGIYNSNSSAVDLINSTITDNSALSGGGCFNNNGEMLLKNTVMAGNAASSGPDIWSNQDVLSNGANFIGTTANIQNAGTLADRTFANTGTTLGDLLAPLTDNGGPTPTHALVAGSPAMDAGINTDAVDLSNNPLATDQRGFARIINGVVDIGAFESEAADNDGDGVADDNDQCPNSDLRLTVWIGGCDSGVSNDIDGALVDADGCSLADDLAHQLTTAATGTRNHGRFVSALARYLNALVRAGIITWAEHEALMDCIGSANRIDFLLP